MAFNLFSGSPITSRRYFLPWSRARCALFFVSIFKHPIQQKPDAFLGKKIMRLLTFGLACANIGPVGIMPDVMIWPAINQCEIYDPEEVSFVIARSGPLPKYNMPGTATGR